MITWQLDFLNLYHFDRHQISALEKLLEVLAGVEDRNLTAVTGKNRIINVHLRDSLSLLAFPEYINSHSVVDVGSGAGFPGLPLAIANPEKEFSLLESNGKKCAFLSSAIEILGLYNVKVVQERAEVAARSDMRHCFDLALARAVGPLTVVLEYTMPLIKIGGFSLLQRGAYKQAEEENGRDVAAILGGSLVSIKSVTPFPGSTNLTVWIFRKIKPTPDRFPRRPGIPKKRPL